MSDSIIDEYIGEWKKIISKQTIDFIRISENYLKNIQECQIQNINQLCDSINNENHAPFDLLYTHFHENYRFNYHECSKDNGAESELRKKFIKLDDDEVYIEIIFDFTDVWFHQFEANGISFIHSTLLPKIKLEIMGVSKHYKKKAKIDILIKREFDNGEVDDLLLKGFANTKSENCYRFNEERLLKAISYSFLFRKISKMYREKNDDLYYEFMHPKGIFGKVRGIFADDKGARMHAKKNNDLAMPLICSEYSELSAMIEIIKDLDVR